MTRVARITLPLAISAMILSGCTGSEESPEPTPTPTPAPTSTSAPEGQVESGSGLPADGPPSTIPAAMLEYQRPETVNCPEPTTTVRDAVGLRDALSAAQAGAVIRLEPGTYAGSFVLEASGERDRPIWLCGSEGATLDGGGPDGDYGLHLDGAAFVNVVGLRVTNAQKGIMVDRGSQIRLQDNHVSGIGDEAIHLRAGTSDSIVLGNTIDGTGLRRDKFGEGIYIGSAESNWSKVSEGRPDASDRNRIIGNTIKGTTAEAVDIKEGTSDGVLAENTFDGSAMTKDGADSWVDTKGNGWLIVNNTGKASRGDGFQTHRILDGWGTKNLFAGNKGSEIGSDPEDDPAVGIGLRPAEANAATCTNDFSSAPISNEECVSIS